MDNLTAEIITLKVQLGLEMIQPLEFIDRLADLFEDQPMIPLEFGWIPPTQSSPAEMRLA